MSKVNLTREDIRKYYGEPSARVKAKQSACLNRHARDFIKLSPFLVIASSDAAGKSDASPRGEAAGFVMVIDDKTLLIPDRPGNRRVDTILNVAENPGIGLLFFVPGIDETLRVNGRAHFTVEDALLKQLIAYGKPPIAGVLVEIEEVFFHCGKALIRSRLWHEETKVDRSSFPSLGRILAEQIPGTSVIDSERSIEDGYQNKLY